MVAAVWVVVVVVVVVEVVVVVGAVVVVDVGAAVDSSDLVPKRNRSSGKLGTKKPERS